MTNPDLRFPLKGMRIVELSTMVTASLSTMMLAEQGADAIKIEPPGMGDPMRYLGTQKKGISGLFAGCNRGKRSVALDLKKSRGRQIAEDIIAEADVLITNFRPGVMKRLGLGSEAMRARNSGLIFVAVSGFGEDGPLAHAPAYDHVIQAVAGFTTVQGEDGTPAYMKTLICDKVTAYTAAQAATAALLVRATSGQGQHIDISMLDACLAFLWPDGMMGHTLLADDTTHLAPISDYYRVFPTSDGYISIAAATDEQWQGVYEVTGRHDLNDDPRFANMLTRSTHVKDLLASVKDSFRELTTEKALELLRGHDVPSARCLHRDEIHDHPQVIAMETLALEEHPLLGSMRVVAPPVRFDEMRNPPGAPVPSLGEHTDVVMAELGIPEAERQTLFEEGVAARPG